mgnify:CR=1 FL=1
MKIFILVLLSATVIFASIHQEVEAKIIVVDKRMENRIFEIEKEIKEKSKERLQKAKVREEKIQKLDETLKEKAKQREESYDSKNNSTNEEIIKELTAKQEPAKANS